MKRKDADKKYQWDFGHLYANVDDWKKDLNQIERLGETQAKFKGKLNTLENFKLFEEHDQQMALILNKLVVYLHLGDVDQTNPLYQELEGLLTNVWQKVNVQTAWVAPEVKELGEQTVLGWIDQDPELAPYRLGYVNFFKEAAHVLSTHDEELLSKVARSRGLIGGMYDSLAFADNQEQKLVYHDQEVVVTGALQLEIMQDSDPVKDQKLRQEVNLLMNKGFIDKKHSFAKVYDGILQSSSEAIKLRNYPSALAASLQGDNIPVEIYLKLLEVARKNIQVFKDYNLLIKKAFGLEKFYPADRQLKLVKEYHQTFSVEQAQTIIKEALSVLGSEYLKNLAVAWSPHRIDYYEDTNKTSGAYSTGGNGVEPIILMNWDDKLNSVTTLAHESGHSVHTLFADATQTYPLNEYPIILAEVASTVNEHLVFDYLITHTTDKSEKIYLLQQRIFDLMSTFYRQVQFADFEYRAHSLVEQEVPQTAESLAKLFNEVQLDYGYDVFDSNLESDSQYVWPRVSHFFHSPYYVYKYAIDVTASYKLYTDIKKGNPDSLLTFLKAGGSKDPLDVLKDAGIDFSQEATYEPLIQAMTEMVGELDQLLNQK